MMILASRVSALIASPITKVAAPVIKKPVPIDNKKFEAHRIDMLSIALACAWQQQGMSHISIALTPNKKARLDGRAFFLTYMRKYDRMTR
jgi:hypothetical protein